MQLNLSGNYVTEREHSDSILLSTSSQIVSEHILYIHPFEYFEQKEPLVKIIVVYSRLNLEPKSCWCSDMVARD